MFNNYLPELRRIADEHKIEVATLMAVIEVESDGVLFASYNGRRVPVIRWEGHYFDRLVAVNKRERAREEGLASPKVGGIKNPKTQQARYDMLGRAINIDRDAAYQSISIGVGQVMGAHWKTLGYGSPQAMFRRAAQGFDGQVEIMMRYIVHFGLLDELQRYDWAGFARGYNGPAYTKNKYDIRLAAAYRKYAGSDAPKSTASGMLRLGSKGARVREVQTLLVRAGYPVNVDGDFGAATKEAVKTFQSFAGLDVDGVVGPKTMAALEAFRVTPDETPGAVGLMNLPAIKSGATGVVGGSSIVLAVNEAAEKVAGVAGQNVTLNLIASGLTTAGALLMLAGVLYAAYGWWKSGQTFEGSS